MSRSTKQQKNHFLDFIHQYQIQYSSSVKKIDNPKDIVYHKDYKPLDRY